MPVSTTFRKAIHEYLNNNKKYWSKLGIDILMGVPTDAVMTASQQQFLPDNLMKALDRNKNPTLVASSANLYPVSSFSNKSEWFTPMVFFSFLLLVFIFLSLSSNKKIQNTLFILDGLLFFITGVVGLIISFMWFGTEHVTTKNNFNIAWAWPTHLIFSFLINKQKNWAKNYFLITAIALLILLVSWFFLPQQMNNALIPFILLLIFRSYMISRKVVKENQQSTLGKLSS